MVYRALGLLTAAFTLFFVLPSLAVPPAGDTLKPPVIVLTDTCPAPRTIRVPSKPGGSYIIQTKSGPRTIPLMPPETKALTVVSRAPDGTPLSDQSAAAHGLFTAYDTDDGLALDAVGYGKSTLCDSKGNIWFGTAGGGVSRYDGNSASEKDNYEEQNNNKQNHEHLNEKNKKQVSKSFATFTTAQGLANNIVLSIAEDKDGNLWFGTGEGLSLLKPPRPPGVMVLT